MRDDELHLAEELILPNLDWEYIAAKAGRNRVDCLMYQNLKKLGPVPSQVLNIFKTAYTAVRFNNEIFREDLQQLIRVFNDRQIPLLLYKGLLLAETVYGDIGRRKMNDIDLLVRKSDWSKIQDIIALLNYTYECAPCKINLSSPVPLDRHNNIAFLNKKNTRLEFHFNFFWLDFPYFQDKNVFTGSPEIDFAGGKILTPSLEDHLLLLCLGLVNYGYRELGRICNINEFIRYYNGKIDWERLIKRAQEKTVSVFLYYGLLFSARLLDTKLPEGVLERLEPGYIRRVLFKSFFNPDDILKLKSADKESVIVPESKTLQMLIINKLTLRPVPLARIFSYYWKYLFPSPRFMSESYSVPIKSPKLYFLYIKRLAKALAFFLRAAT